MALIKHKWLPIFDHLDCSACRACPRPPTCHSGALSIIDGKVRFDSKVCLSNERCVDQCPMGKIRMEWVPFSGHSNVGLFRV